MARFHSFLWLNNICVCVLPWWLSGKEPAYQCRRLGFDSLGQEGPLEKEMATHSTILAWEIPWTEEPGGLKSMESQKSWTQLSNWTTMCVYHNFFIHSPIDGNLVNFCLFVWVHSSFSKIILMVNVLNLCSSLNAFILLLLLCCYCCSLKWVKEKWVKEVKR